ncbi:Mitochondrial Fe/S cluster exporter, ABC superfamily [Pseudoloma neurophilia]|uniref:Mitochondrial Fe/S cluster exporter, ABC superfamily n=1 Tax=Pseudoloma neurophilia TaxID=146866 RepID=A0A0R0M592_9MICR|nr:Mitochondrial Fe/S cluster exporter, ABC superfamily [Pseudoloma neurophilia]
MSPLFFFIKRYLFGNTLLLFTLIPVFICMFISKYCLVRTNVYIGIISDETLDSNISYNSIIFLGVLYLLHSFFDELFTIISLGPIFEITRQSNVKFLEICLLERDLCDYRQGEIARSLIRGSEAISTIIELSLIEIFPVLVTICFAYFRIGMKIGLGAFFANVFVLTVYISLTIIITGYRVSLRRKRNKHEDIAYSQALENIRNIDTIITYKTKDHEIGKFDQTNKQIKKYHIRLDQVLAFLNFTQSFLLYSFLVIFLYKNYADMKRNLLVEYITLSLSLFHDLDKVGCIYHRFCKLIVDLKSPFISDIVKRIQIRANEQTSHKQKSHKKTDNNEQTFDKTSDKNKQTSNEIPSHKQSENDLFKVPYPKNDIEFLSTSEIEKKAKEVNENALNYKLNPQSNSNSFVEDSQSNHQFINLPKRRENDLLNVTDSLTMFDRPIYEETFTNIPHLDESIPHRDNSLTHRDHSIPHLDNSLTHLDNSITQKNHQSLSLTKFDNSIYDQWAYHKNLDKYKEILPVICLFNNVNIHYHKKNRLLSHIFLSLRKSEKIAIVGPNGTGKSSFIKSILGFVPITGQIYISENTNLVYASQDTQLFNNTVFYNLTYGMEGLSLEKVINTANLLQISDRLQKIGYNSMITECGKNLSGGQKQAIVILRSALKCLFTTKTIEKHEEIQIEYGHCGKRGCSCMNKRPDNLLYESEGHKIKCDKRGCSCMNKRNNNLLYESEGNKIKSSSSESKDNCTEISGKHTNRPFNDDYDKNFLFEHSSDKNSVHESKSNSDFTDESVESENIQTDIETSSSESEIPNNTLLLLDEATSAIDKHTEYLLLNSLFNLLQDTTILMVIHNLSYLELFDKIIFIGKEIEFDTFSNLKLKNKHFKEFYDKSRQKKEKKLVQTSKQLDVDKKLFIKSNTNLQ